MTEEQQDAIDSLRSGNMSLAQLMKSTVELALEKNKTTLAEGDGDVNDILSAIRVVETAGKIVGLTPKETQTNISLNAVVGFDFIEVDEEDIRQITGQDEYEDADLEDEEEL